MEVTVAGSDVAVWTEVPVPAQTATTGMCPALENFVPNGIGEVGVRASKTGSLGSNPYILWRIHEESPKSLELIEFSCEKPVHNSGLRLTFESALCPFANVVLVQELSNSIVYNVTVLTISGLLYSISLKVGRVSKSRLSMQHQSTVERDVSGELTGLGKVTALTATPELLIVGGQSGSIVCFPVGRNSDSGPDHSFELKEAESGLSRLWALGFRGKTLSPVKCLATQSLSGASLLFAVYEDRNLKVWDLVHRNSKFSQSMSPPLQLASSTPQSIWIEDSPGNNQELQLALHYTGNPSSPETQRSAVVVCILHATTQSDGGIRVSHLALRRTFSIGQGYVLSCKMLNDRVWVLQRSSSKSQCELLYANLEEDFTLQKCRLQESSVSEQLFHGTGQSWDELLFALHHIGLDSPSVDDDLVPSLFLRRLLQPGLRQHAALKAVLQIRGRYLSDFEVSSLTLDGLRKEIKASIRAEPSNSSGTLKEWIGFCSSYVESWNHNSVPYGLFMDISTGSVGLIRKNSVSVIRTLTLLEQLVPKKVTGNGEAVGLPQDWDEAPGDSAVLGGLLKCLQTITSHLGQMALGVFHEALLRPPGYSLDSLISSFLLILDVGYTPLDSAQVNLAFGVDEIRSKMQLHHQRQRKFALRISQSLQSLQASAGSWEVVLDVVSKYAQYLVFSTQSALPASNSVGVPLGSAPTKMLAQATGQISWTHFEASQNLLLLLSYLVKVQGQVGLTPSEVARIQLNLFPRVQEGLAINLLLHWLTVSFAEVPPSEDCSLQLSSLQIDGSRGEKVQPEMLGAGELALAEILAAAFLETTQVQEKFSRDCLPNPDLLHNCASRFVGWLLVGESSDPYPLTFSGRAITLSSILLQHGQYGSLESFLNAVEQFSAPQQLSDGIASIDGEWSARLHLLGICSLARAHSVLENTSKGKHIGKATQCFFRAASGLGEANKVLQTVFFVPQQQLQGGRGPTAAWRLQYFEWVMQLFDQYNQSEGACQFAHAALEQVDEAVGVSVMEDSDDDSNVTIKGRLWANVFKFSLDLELYGNAYCAIISNPDEESKDICLRRLIIILCDHKASQALCGNELPYGSLLSRVEEELVTKAYNSDLSVKAGLFKLLYALHMHHHNVGRAAGYMYEYGMSLRDQGLSKSPSQSLSLLNEQLDAFAAAINALQLMETSDELVGSRIEWLSPIKRQRISANNLSNGKMIHVNRVQDDELRTIDVEHLVKEHALTLARVQLLSADTKRSSLGANVPPSEVVILLLQNGLYEMAFSLVFLCWKDSSQKRELEIVFEVIARKCCLVQLRMASNSPQKIPEDFQALTLVPDSPSNDLEQWGAMSTDIRTQSKSQTGTLAKSAWQSLKEYLEKYLKVHSNIRAVVADTILSVDRHMELPLWLINTFKGGKDSRGMSSGGGWVADPAALFRIYLNHERYVEASYLLLEYLQAATRLRPGDVIKRKQACGVWFPYTLVDRLLQHLAEIHGSDDMNSQSKRLHTSIHNAVLHHFDLIKKESDDVRVIAETADFNGPWKGFS